MLFNSFEFILVFLPVCWLLFAVAYRASRELAVTVLIAASLVFYSYWSWAHTPLLLASMGVNYCAYRLANRLEDERARRIVTGAVIAFNVLALVYFKYIGFLLFDVLGIDRRTIDFDQPHLPLAISFYTFQQVSFLVDNLRQRFRITPVDYAFYVTFFPHLIAGPIVRHSELVPQIAAYRLTLDQCAYGLCLFTLGLAKKVLIADTFSVWVRDGFAKTADLSIYDAWSLALAYTLQLYFDFSGYSDMAIGLAALFGFRFPLNFNSPYKATSIQDFWRRWHITLSNMLRDYVYIPLGGNRYGSLRTYANLMATMLIGGIWHGAGWTFLLWGGLHGGALALNRWAGRWFGWLPAWTGWLATFLFVVHAWVVFRAGTVTEALNVFASMWAINGLRLPDWMMPALKASGAAAVPGVLPEAALPVLLAFVVFTVAMPNAAQVATALSLRSTRVQTAWFAALGILFAVTLKRLMEASAPTEFLYFQF